MTKLLLHLFIREGGDPSNAEVRNRYGKLAGLVGIVSNTFLFLIKMLAGILSGSVAIIADSVNNLSDSSSSVITIIGFKIAGKPADEKHPYGHARSEYISGLMVSILIVFIGLQLILSSVDKILHPSAVSFDWLSITILAVSIAVKLWQCLFYRRVGSIICSKTMTATSTDSLNDVVSTAAVLLSVLVAKYTGWDLDGYMGLLVAAFILYSGVRLILDTLNPLLGVAPDDELVQTIEDKIKSYHGVIGLHDLVIHNYGYGRCFASVHVEVPNTQSLVDSHDQMDNIERDFSNDLGIHLVIHTDPVIIDDEETNRCRELVKKLVHSIDPELSMHDFRMVSGTTHTNLIFDLEVPPAYKIADDELRRMFEEMLTAIDETYYAVITIDRSYLSTTMRKKV